jgi:hypothetical protein
MDLAPRRVFVFPEERLVKVVATGLALGPRRAAFRAMSVHIVSRFIPLYCIANEVEPGIMRSDKT